MNILNELNNYYYEKREFKLFVDINDLINYVASSKYGSIEKEIALKILSLGTEKDIKQEMDKNYFNSPCNKDNMQEQYGYYIVAYLAQRDLLEENMRYDGICTKCGNVNSIKESYIITPPYTECDICGNHSFVKGECKCKDYVITWAAKEEYEWDSEETLTAKEFIDMIAARETTLATIKQRNDEYKASKGSAIPAAPVAGGFNF